MDSSAGRIAGQFDAFRAAVDAGACPRHDTVGADLPEAEREQLRRLCRNLLTARRFLSRGGLTDGRDPNLGKLLDDFRLIDRLGSGATGTVYLARQVSVERNVAVKVLHPSLAAFPEACRRFANEGRIVGAFDHPGIVRVINAGEAQGLVYIAMEWVSGVSLEDVLAPVRNRIAADPTAATAAFRQPREAVELARDVAAAAAHAHARGVIHRDVKPGNILLDGERRARLTDFGLARAREGEGLTRSSDTVGTPVYMAPEQLAPGTFKGTVGPASDVYSIGAVLFELLTMRRPFGAERIGDLIESMKRAEAPPVRRFNPAVPPDLAAIVAKAIEIDPERRYADASELQADLERFLRFEAVEARALSTVERASRWSTRNRRSIGLVAFGAALVGAAAFVYWWHDERNLNGDLLANAAASWETFRVDPENGDPAEATRIRRALETVHEAGIFATAADRRSARTFLDATTVLASDLARRGREAIGTASTTSHAQGSSSPTYSVWSPGQYELLLGLKLLARASALLPGDEGLRREADLLAHLPRLIIGSDVAGASVFLRPIDWITGEYGAPKLIGKTPLDVRVLPNRYRIVVKADDDRFAELVRRLGDWNTTVDCGTVALRTSAELSRPTAVVPGERVDAYTASLLTAGMTATVGAFRLEIDETTNADFSVFVRATGRETFGKWSPEMAERAPDLPATGMRQVDAVAYLEWAGLRLPTILEWHLAALGANWLSKHGPGFGSTAPNIGRLDSGAPVLAANADDFERYYAFAEPTTSETDDVTALGIRRLFGNVAEFTETIPVREDAGRFFPDLTMRFVMGFSFTSRKTVQHFDRVASIPTGVPVGTLNVGIRGARSVDPLRF